MTSWLSVVAFGAVWTIDAILKLANPTDPQLHPDGRRYAYVWKGEIYTASIGSSNPTPVAAGSRPRWADTGVVYLGTDRQVHSGTGQALTASPTPVLAYAISRSADQVFYLANEPGPAADPIVSGTPVKPVRLYRKQRQRGRAAPVSPPEWHVTSFDISSDSRRAVCAVQRSPLNKDAFHVDLHEIDLDTGATRPLVEQPGRDADPSYSPDGKTIAFHSQGGTLNYFEARHVAVVPSGGGKVRYLTANTAYDVFRNGNTFAWSPDSRSISYTAGHGTIDVLLRQQLDSLEISVLAERISGSASFAGAANAVFVRSYPDRPSELAQLAGGAEKALAGPGQSAIADLPVLRSRVVRWRSPDGLDLEGVLWLPIAYREGKRVPLLVELHGGPTGVALDSFPIPRTYPVQVFLQQGAAVFQPNFRGSSNYGAAFRLRNTLSQGVGDYQDVMSGVDRLIADGIADPDRLGVMGWSYGGYLTGAVITQTRRFSAASIGAPAVDWLTYYGQFDGSKEVLWTYFGGTPWAVPENYIRHSTRAGLRNIRIPTLLQVGQEDLNHNAEIFQALTDLMVPVEYVIYPREGHGITEPGHQRDLMERNLRWFAKWLMN